VLQKKIQCTWDLEDIIFPFALQPRGDSGFL
jgi:hypothetical protein